MAELPIQEAPEQPQDQLLRSDDLDHPGLFINR